MQPCSVAKLLSAISGNTIESSFEKVGLVLCPRCNKAGTKPEFYPYCCKAHTREPSSGVEVIPLICDECDILFYRRTAEVRKSIKKGRGLAHVWCGKKCQGSWWGKQHGFLQYPEHRLSNEAKVKEYCKRDHLSAGNRNTHGQCRLCVNIGNRIRYARRKGLVQVEVS